MKNTKKNLLSFSTKRFSLILINEDGSRGLWTANVHGLRLIYELVNCGHHCRYVLLEEENARDIIESLYPGFNPMSASQLDSEFYDKIKAFRYTMDYVH